MNLKFINPNIVSELCAWSLAVMMVEPDLMGEQVAAAVFWTCIGWMLCVILPFFENLMKMKRTFGEDLLTKFVVHFGSIEIPSDSTDDPAFESNVNEKTDPDDDFDESDYLDWEDHWSFARPTKDHALPGGDEADDVATDSVADDYESDFDDVFEGHWCLASIELEPSAPVMDASADDSESDFDDVFEGHWCLASIELEPSAPVMDASADDSESDCDNDFDGHWCLARIELEPSAPVMDASADDSESDCDNDFDGHWCLASIELEPVASANLQNDLEEKALTVPALTTLDYFEGARQLGSCPTHDVVKAIEWLSRDPDALNFYFVQLLNQRMNHSEAPFPNFDAVLRSNREVCDLILTSLSERSPELLFWGLAYPMVSASFTPDHARNLAAQFESTSVDRVDYCCAGLSLAIATQDYNLFEYGCSNLNDEELESLLYDCAPILLRNEAKTSLLLKYLSNFFEDDRFFISILASAVGTCLKTTENVQQTMTCISQAMNTILSDEDITMLQQVFLEQVVTNFASDGADDLNESSVLYHVVKELSSRCICAIDAGTSMVLGVQLYSNQNIVAPFVVKMLSMTYKR